MGTGGEWRWALLFLGVKWWGLPARGLRLLSSSLCFFSIIVLEESCERSGFLKRQGYCVLFRSQLPPSSSMLDLVEVASLDCAYTKSQVPGGVASWSSGNFRPRHGAHFWLHTCRMDFSKLKGVKRMTETYWFWFMMEVERNVYFGWTAKSMGEPGHCFISVWKV